MRKLPAAVSAAFILGMFSSGAHASLLYTFAADGFGIPDSLNSMDPGSAASVANLQTPVGDQSIGFNGGLVLLNNLLYAVGNDSLGDASLYSMQKNGQGLTTVSSNFNSSGDSSGYGFYNGLASNGSQFYTIGSNGSTEELFQIGAGTATAVRPLNSFGGSYAGLAWDPALAEFYGIVVNATGDFSGDLLVSFGLSGIGFNSITRLTNLDGAETGTHLGGLADGGSGILYDLFIDPNTGTGQLEQINLNGSPSTTFLYDSGIPLTVNAGLAIQTTPEPATVTELAAGLLLGWILKRKLL